MNKEKTNLKGIELVKKTLLQTSRLGFQLEKGIQKEKAFKRTQKLFTKPIVFCSKLFLLLKNWKLPERNIISIIGYHENTQAHNQHGIRKIS